MNRYLTMTFMVVCGFYSSIIFVAMPRFKYFNGVDETTGAVRYDKDKNCGPFESDNVESPISEVGLFPNTTDQISTFLLCSLVQIVVYTLLFHISKGISAYLGVLDNVKSLKFKEYEKKIKDMQKRLHVLDTKERILR